MWTRNCLTGRARLERYLEAGLRPDDAEALIEFEHYVEDQRRQTAHTERATELAVAVTEGETVPHHQPRIYVVRVDKNVNAEVGKLCKEVFMKHNAELPHYDEQEHGLVDDPDHRPAATVERQDRRDRNAVDRTRLIERLNKREQVTVAGAPPPDHEVLDAVLPELRTATETSDGHTRPSDVLTATRETNKTNTDRNGVPVGGLHMLHLVRVKRL